LLSHKLPRYMYIISGFIGSLLFSEKQIALVFPLVTLGYLFITNRKWCMYYLSGFISGILLILLLYQSIYHTFTPYDGKRGLVRFENGIQFDPQGIPHIFVFPFNYIERFIEYFFGKNIGIFIYNPFSILFGIYFLYALIRRKWLQLILFLPVLVYVSVYFLVVNPYYSYGGATSLGNRYFFQIYVYVLLVVFIYSQSYLKQQQALLSTVVGMFIMSLFALLVYRPFFIYMQRALKDHIFIVENKKLFSFLPVELSYSSLIYTDLHLANSFNNYIAINNGFAVLEEQDKRGITQNNSYIIETSQYGNFRLDSNTNVIKIKSYNSMALKTKSKYYALYKVVHCNNKICLYLSKL
ncbi:MAG TPA: hypothetical protein PLS49_02450, partial [Candidatus Woesebacteria bacterium]|nr:hypothetical protein [Candidatus Woesebacteria bacterium]